MINPATRRQLAHSTGQLLFLGLSPEMRLCTHSTVQVLGQEWLHGDFTVAPIQVGQQGVVSIAITFGDVTREFARRVRDEFKPGIVCEWHMLELGRSNWEAEHQFSGTLEKVHIARTGELQIEAMVTSADTAFAPRVVWESSFSMPRGSEIVINGTMYRVE